MPRSGSYINILLNKWVGNDYHHYLSGNADNTRSICSFIVEGEISITYRYF